MSEIIIRRNYNFNENLIITNPGLASRDSLNSAGPLFQNAPQWFAAYTRPRHEKQVFEQLKARSIECMLPLYESLRQWRDRRTKVQLPLFASYIFARVTAAGRMQVLTVPGVVNLVSSAGRPCAIADEEMDTLRLCLDRQAKAEPHPFLAVGRRVRVVRGSFAGMEGVLVRKKGLYRLVLSIDLIQRSVAIEIDVIDVSPIFGSAGDCTAKSA